MNVKNLNSLLFAIILSANIIAISANNILGIKENFIVITIFSCAFISIIVNKGRNLLIVILISFFVSFFFLFSYLINGENEYTNSYLQSFIVFGIASIIIVSQRFNYKKVLVYLMTIYGVLGIVMTKIDFRNMESGNLMGLGYLILPVLLVSILFIFEKNSNKLLRIFSILIFLWYGYFMFLVGSRGAILSVLLFVFSMIFIKSKSTLKRSVTFIVFIGIISIIFINLLEILMRVKEILLTLNINSSFVDKTIIKIETNSFDNGRLNLFDTAINIIKSNVFFGIGIGEFEYNYGYYIHNLFLQMLSEGGILLTIPFLILISYGIFNIYFNRKVKYDYNLFLCLIFCVSIPKLFVSSVFWKEQTFWILISLFLNLIASKVYSKQGLQKERNE